MEIYKLHLTNICCRSIAAPITHRMYYTFLLDILHKKTPYLKN